MYSPTPKSHSHMESISQEPRPGLIVYKEVCRELGKSPSSNVASGITGNTLVLKVDALMNHEMNSLKLLFERHQFQKIALYKESIELGDIFDPKTASLKPKYLNKSPQLSMSQKSFSRMSSGVRSKSPQSEQKKAKAIKTSENLNLFCKILIPQLTQSSTLESLKFFCISFTKESLRYLATGIKGNQTLKELSISYCDLTSNDLQIIFGAIGENNNLNFLDLSHNQLDDDAGRMLANIIGVHGRKRDEILWVYSIRGDQPEEDPELKGICDLNVSFNHLGSKALVDMCSSLKYDTWLKNLNLRGNQIGDEGIIELKKVLAQNNSIFAIDLRDNPFYNPKLSREIITKLATNIQNYKNKNMMLPSEDSSQIPYEGEQNTFDNMGYMGRTGSDKMNNPALNEEIDELIKKYEANGLLEEDNQEEENKRIEGVSFGFRNEKIKENLRKDYKKLRVKQTKSEGRVNFGQDYAGGEGGCPNCKQLEKKLLLSESKSVNMLLENYKLKKKLNAILQAQNSWSAISPQFNEIENTSNIPHPESISQDLFKKNTMTLGDPGAPDSDEVFNKIENLMAELTRMMDNLENANATNNFTGHFTNSTHLTNNNTYQLINSANNINFNSTTNILNSNNNSRVHARANPNLQHTISMHHGNNPDISKSFSRVHQQRNNPNLHNYSEQNADKSDNQESKVNTQFSLFFQNENSHMNHSHS